MLFQYSDDAYIVGKMHGLLGAPEEVLEADNPDSRFWSHYQRGRGEGITWRREFLERGLSNEQIVKYAEAYFAGWADAAIQFMGGPDPGRDESLRRAALKH